MAHSVSYCGAVTCPELGANRKWPTQNQSDAIAPNSDMASDVVGARFRCTPLRPGVGHGSVGEKLSEKVRRVAPPLHNV